MPLDKSQFIKPRRYKYGKMAQFNKKIPKLDGNNDKALRETPKDIRDGIKATGKFKSGRCQRCGDYDEILYPYLDKVCKDCVEKHIRNGGQPIAMVDSKLLFQSKCITCDRTKGIFLTVNFRACQKCVGKITRLEKRYDQKQAHKDAQRMDRKLERKVE